VRHDEMEIEGPLFAKFMMSGGFLFIVATNVFFYARKVILFRAGYKVGLFIHRREFRHMCELAESAAEPKRKRRLELLNLAPVVCFVAGALLFFGGVYFLEL
jgi:hypothetical protein